MSLAEGRAVSYVGHPDAGGLEIGDEGRVLSSSGSACHVRWATGRLSGQITMTAASDLVPGTYSSRNAYATVDDALAEGPLVTHAVREVYDTEGEAGLLQALAEEGHLAMLSDAVEEAVDIVAARIRRDPSFRSVLSHLDDDEGDSLVSLAATVLVRDVFEKDH